MSKLNFKKFSLDERCGNLIKICELFLNEKYCWLNALNIKRVSERSYELITLFPELVLGSTIKYLARIFGISYQAHINHSEKHIYIKNFYRINNENQILEELDNNVYYGSHPDIGRTINYSITNIANRETIGYENASGFLGDYSKDYVKGALNCPYACNQEQQEAIRKAFNHRLVLFKYPGKEVSHPHLKFLADHMNNSLLELDYEDKAVKILGPKFNNYEVEAVKTAKSVHFCTKMPATLDINRSYDSKKSIERNIRTSKNKIKEMKEIIDNLKKEQTKKAGSEYVLQISENILKISEQISHQESNLIDYEEQHEAVTTSEKICNSNVCNVGAEKCEEKCDVAIALHSIYDINLRELLTKQGRLGMQELYCTVILPFGLLFVDNYYSEELQVQFRKVGRGFMMIHGKDMSNGYVHQTAGQIMNLMRTSFVEAAGVNWMYEIVDSKGEMCKLRFTRANPNQRIVRKLVPAKFDNTTVIMNPLDYFGRTMKRTPILVAKDKYEAAIKSVERSKKNKEIVEDTFAFVQASFMKVVVGNTELQSGGVLDSDLESAIVLAAIIEGGIRKHLVGDAYRRCLNTSKPLAQIWDSLKKFFEYCVLDNFTIGLWSYLKQSSAEKYIKERFNLGDLILDSNAKKFDKLTRYYENINFDFGDFLEEAMERAPPLKDFINSDENQNFGSDKIGKTMNEMWYGKEAGETLNDMNEEMKRIEKYQRAQKYIESRAALEEIKEAQKNIVLQNEDQIKQNKLFDEMYEGLENMLKEIEAEVSDIETLSTGSSTLYKENDQIEIDPDLTSLPYDSHDIDSTIHIEGKMDDLTKAAFAFNKKRAEMIKRNEGQLSSKEIEQLVNRYTKKGATSKPTVSMEFIKTEIEKLRNMYAVDQSLATEVILKKLKDDVLETIKKVQNDGSLDKVLEKDIDIIQGFAGSGKTTYVLNNFDVSKDAYISPLAGILYKFYADLKEKKKEEMKFCKRSDMVKTFEKFMEIRKSGRYLYIDECSKFSLAYLLVIMAYTNYEKYIFIGDPEQTKTFDPTSEMSSALYTDLIPFNNITRFLYTFRFGPSAAALLNSSFNYPVFSLKQTDTRISYNDLDDFNSSVKGTNITITRDTMTYLKEDLNVMNIMTATASQGLTVPVVNLYMRSEDLHAALSFRSNGIVAASRMTDELNIYYNTTSAKKNTSNLEWLRENFATTFDIVLPNNSDF